MRNSRSLLIWMLVCCCCCCLLAVLLVTAEPAGAEQGNRVISRSPSFPSSRLDGDGKTIGIGQGVDRLQTGDRHDQGKIGAIRSDRQARQDGFQEILRLFLAAPAV